MFSVPRPEVMMPQSVVYMPSQPALRRMESCVLLRPPPTRSPYSASSEKAIP